MNTQQLLYTTNKQTDTVFVTLSDEGYFNRAKRTIADLRSVGKWQGDIVLINVNYTPNPTFIKFYNVIEKTFPLIDKLEMFTKLKTKFPDGDGREFDKINQWEKLHVFDDYFKQWKRVIFVDAGLRILDSVEYLLDIDYENYIVAPNDAGYFNKPDKIFRSQVSFYNPELIKQMTTEFGDILDKQYFLNCIWIYDTSILEKCNKEQLIATMNKYPLCKTNEMTIMNLMFHFKHNLWREMPLENKNGKILFEWCELNHPNNKQWYDFCYIKYPVTISFEDV